MCNHRREQFISFGFENVAISYLSEKNIKGLLPYNYNVIRNYKVDNSKLGRSIELDGLATGLGKDKNSVLEWRNITKITANRDCFIGLKADKTLETTGKLNLDSWKNVSDIKGSGEYVIGIIKTKQ